MAEELTPEEKEQREKWKQEINENKAVQQYFSQFRADSIDEFVDYYVDKKSRWMKNSATCLRMMNDESVEWVNEAFKHLEIILQKKLFDLQCLWRAERVKIADIKLCCEFDYWESDILNCPFLELITNDELDLYIAYLQFPGRDLDEDDMAFDHGWQDYEEIKKAERDEEDARKNFPEWYDFANIRTGADNLLLLPDIRGEKEEMYLDIYHKEFTNNKSEEPVEVVKRDERPCLYTFNDEVMEYFVQTFESNEVKDAYRSDKWNYKNSYIKWDLDLYIDTLLSAEEEIPIEANSSWIEGIRKAVEKYKRKKIVEALPEAWAQYNMNKEMGLAFPRGKRYTTLIDFYTESILAARKLKGEPEDLDF